MGSAALPWFLVLGSWCLALRLLLIYLLVCLCFRLRDVEFEFDSKRLGGHVYFAQFQTRSMVSVIDMVKQHQVHHLCAVSVYCFKYVFVTFV